MAPPAKFKPIKRSDPNAVTFRIVSAPQDDPRVVEASDRADRAAVTKRGGDNEAAAPEKEEFYIWQRVPRKGGKKTLPDDLAKIFAPEDFGIHSNLRPLDKVTLCKEIYGTSTIPAVAAPPGEGARRGGPEGAGRLSKAKRNDILLDASEDDDDDDANGRREEKLMKLIHGMGDDGDDHEEDDGDLVVEEEWEEEEEEADAASDKENDDTARRRRVPGRTTVSSPLDQFRYFPDDGHDYEKHLRRVGTGGGVYVPATATNALAAKKANASSGKGKVNNDEQIPPEILRTAEGRELLACLREAEEQSERSSEGEAMGLQDDFVTQAKGVKEDIDKELLWGRVPEPTGGPADSLMGLIMSREERAALLDQYGGGSSDEADSDDGGGSMYGVGNGDDDDDEFRKVMEEYGGDNIGELESGDEGVLEGADADVEDFKHLYENGFDYKSELFGHKYRPADEAEADAAQITPLDDTTRAATVALAQAQEEADMEKGSSEESDEEDEDDRYWDCQTILTSRSTTLNRPSSIGRPPSVAPSTLRLAGQLQLPVEYLPSHLQKSIATSQISLKNTDKIVQKRTLIKLAIPEDEEVDGATEFVLPEVITKRESDETPEQRRERKKKVREAKRVIRQMKKKNSEIVKGEQMKEARKVEQKNAFDVREGVRRTRFA